MPDTFSNMTSLLSNVPPEGNYDFEICTSRRSAIKLFAPHGGCIEPGTAPIVKALAGTEYDYFIFRGTHTGGGCQKLLHVTSTHYDEERCQSMSRSAQLSLSIHGCRGKERLIEVGGGNRVLVQSLFAALQSEYSVVVGSGDNDGSDPQNFINLAADRGVQVEFSEGFREYLFNNYPGFPRQNPETFPQFTRVMKAWLEKIACALKGSA